MVHVRVNGAEKRRLRRELSFFLEALSLQLLGGYELVVAWEAAERASGSRLSGWDEVPWRALARDWGVPEHRLWFRLLDELHRTGAPLVPLVSGFATAIRRERERDLERFCRTLPTRLSVLLVLCYLPAAFLLWFVPLLTGSGL